MDSTPTSNPHNIANVQWRPVARNAHSDSQLNSMRAFRNNHYTSHLNRGPYFIQPSDEGQRIIPPLPRSSQIQRDPRAPGSTLLSDLENFPPRLVPVRASEELEVQQNRTLQRGQVYHTMAQITEIQRHIAELREEGNLTSHINPGPYFVQPNDEGQRNHIIIPARLHRDSENQRDPSARTPRISVSNILANFPLKYLGQLSTTGRI